MMKHAIIKYAFYRGEPMNKIFKFSFPFRGQVKTQLIISKNRLVKPKNVKNFENAVRTILSVVFPFENRPIEGYLRFDMVHYSQYKRDNDDAIVPKKISDIDNIYKTLADAFEPIYIKKTKLDENGEIVYTKKGQPSYTKIMVSPGVIKNDKFIYRANLTWVPVEFEEEEKIEVFVRVINEEELFNPPDFSSHEIIDLSL